jgi:hypothetical protein
MKAPFQIIPRKAELGHKLRIHPFEFTIILSVMLIRAERPFDAGTFSKIFRNVIFINVENL